MAAFRFGLSWSPILLIFILAVCFRTRALTLSVCGLVYCVLLAATVFVTAWPVIGLAALDGVITTIPLLLVVYAGILLSVFLLEQGSLQRLAEWLAGSRGDRTRRALVLSFGMGNFLEGAGVIAEPVAAPMLRASGIAPEASATLSILGYAGLMHLSLAGVIVTVLAAVTGLDLAVLARELALLSFTATAALALAVPWVLGRETVRAGTLILGVAAALIAATAALVAVAVNAVSIAAMLAGLAVMLGIYVISRQAPAISAAPWRDLAPFLFIFVGLAAVNLIPPLHRLAFDRLVVRIELVPGHGVFLRPWFDAYLYIGLALLLAVRIHRPSATAFRNSMAQAGRKAVPALVAMALFGAMGQVVAFSGYSADFGRFDPNNNLALTLAGGLIRYTGGWYPLFAPVLGWVGTFLTGYGVASIMLFARLQLETAAALGASPQLLAGALAVGASIGSVSSPFKIAIATPLCGAEGREGEILRRTIPLGLAAALLVGLHTLIAIALAR
ncbi:MAG: hypothetical protein COT06_00990 [Syntrophobacteraceae bacterium CG07_land_8_20_14_0_80_61_8]|nr:MAG: hypothetical protein COT06_00990 [Syntrophobacteraceae bacterium CG07_land_8_20_14_0_80_61_8]